MRVTFYGVILTFFIYLSVALISVAMFGSQVQSVILTDIGEAKTPSGGSFWEGYVTQIAFMILIACHIPFIFFSGKEGLLIILDEYDRKSISNALWHKL
jgi:hypothetical protein